MKELCFDELDIEWLSELFIHYKGNEQFYKHWNELYRLKFESFLLKKRKAHNEKPGEVKTEVDKILEEFLVYW